MATPRPPSGAAAWEGSGRRSLYAADGTLTDEAIVRLVRRVWWGDLAPYGECRRDRSLDDWPLKWAPLPRLYGLERWPAGWLTAAGVWVDVGDRLCAQLDRARRRLVVWRRPTWAGGRGIPP